ncbi:MAG TPA: mitofilin family membrane protein [Caulobacteraceae bacterium]|nr:mitofilin family membrane protein [Caulobacteraceae bacterium]
MSMAPEPDELGGPGLPRDPHEYALRRRGLGVAFWAMIAFGLVCILAGVAIDRYGPKLFPPKTAPTPAAPPAAATDATPVPAAASDATAPPSAAPGAQTPAALAGLTARVDRLDADNQRLRAAAAEALAAADLGQAAQTSRPFADEVAALSRLLPDSPDLRALAAYAASGAPSRANLAIQLDGLADHIVVAAQEPPKDSGALAHLGHMLAAVFTVRRVDRLTGSDPDAILARAQRRADEGDLEGAVREVDTLSPAGREAAAAWLAEAGRRIEVDRLTAAIRAAAEHDLTAQAQSAA